MKFGGSVLKNSSCFAPIASLIQRRHAQFSHLIVVVSAMGDMTDELVSLAYGVHPSPPKREKDMLISVGERVSMSLLAMALDREGIEAISFTGSQSGIITTDEHAEAEILEVRPSRIRQELSRGKVVIVAGFQGVSLSKEITTLGRGGSDTSAVALGAALGADHVEFYKDVPGIGERDPNLDPTASIYRELSFGEALRIVEGAEVLHPRCVALAEKSALPLEVRSFKEPDQAGTRIGGEKCLM